MDSPHILIVDDDPDILKIIQDNLEIDGYLVFAAANGQEALQLFEQENINLIVLDLSMADMDGIMICRTIRKKSEIPIIMLTARDTLTDKILGLESGADDYLVKPFEYMELEARIKTRLRRTILQSSYYETLELGEVIIYSATQSVEIDGITKYLTKKEFAILFLLMKHHGNLLSREKIKQEIWPEKKLYKWSRSLDVHIQHLREKLEINPSQPRYIITVPGAGYMFISNFKHQNLPG